MLEVESHHVGARATRSKNAQARNTLEELNPTVLHIWQHVRVALERADERILRGGVRIQPHAANEAGRRPDAGEQDARGILFIDDEGARTKESTSGLPVDIGPQKQ